jgi:hypothetical protein
MLRKVKSPYPLAFRWCNSERIGRRGFIADVLAWTRRPDDDYPDADGYLHPAEYLISEYAVARIGWHSERRGVSLLYVHTPWHDGLDIVGRSFCGAFLHGRSVVVEVLYIRIVIS